MLLVLHLGQVIIVNKQGALILEVDFEVLDGFGGILHNAWQSAHSIYSQSSWIRLIALHFQHSTVLSPGSISLPSGTFCFSLISSIIELTKFRYSALSSSVIWLYEWFDYGIWLSKQSFYIR